MNGNRIRQARQKMGYTFAEVAEKTSCTISFLSQLERNLKQPSLATLRKIAYVLECSEVWLLAEEDAFGNELGGTTVQSQSGYVVRKDHRAQFDMPEIHTNYEIITPTMLHSPEQPKISGLFVKLAPGAWVTEKMIQHRNMDESVFILSGRMRATLGEETFELEAQDSLYIPQGVLHNYMNCGDEELKAVVYFSSLIF